jgi:hypothetical protein
MLPKNLDDLVAMVQKSTGMSRKALEIAAEDVDKNLESYCEDVLLESHIRQISHGFLSATLALCWPENMPGLEEMAQRVMEQTQRAIQARPYDNHSECLRGILYEMGQSAIFAIELFDGPLPDYERIAVGGGPIDGSRTTPLKGCVKLEPMVYWDKSTGESHEYTPVSITYKYKGVMVPEKNVD